MRKILKASAGTGKTYRLSLEFVAALIKGQPFEEIAVMTFTRKATAEIRERIIEHLEELLEHTDQSGVFRNLKIIYPELELNYSALKESYTDMLKNKDRLNIYTIDSFVNRIFKQAIAPYLGIYNYQIIEEEKNTEIVERVFKEVLDNPGDFALLERFLTDNPERKIEHYLKLISDMLDNRWKFLLIKHRPGVRQETGDLTLYLDEMINLLKDIIEIKKRVFSADFLISDFRILIPEYLKLDSREAKEDLIIKNRDLFFQKGFWSGNKVRGKEVIHLKEMMEERYDSFRAELALYTYNQEMIPYEEEIFSFSSRIFTIYDRIKFNERIFTHNDISNYTYKYLSESSLNLLTGNRVSDYFFELLGTEVKSLLIDEFQDTSILQWRILKPLIDRSVHVISVGDEKQSIYGWRGGEKELFARLDQILEGENESLKTCYRSERVILRFVNRFFAGINYDWDYEEVDCLSEKDKGFVEVLLGGEGLITNTETRTFQNLSEEKQQEIIELNNLVTLNLKKEIAKRIRELPACNQVAVLARSNDDLSDIAAELAREGIPYLLESKDSLIDHQAVKPLYFLLAYLTYRDYLELLKFLRSDLVGINNRELKYLVYKKDMVESFMIDREEELAEESLKQVLLEIKKLDGLTFKELTNRLIEKTGVIRLYRNNSGALKNIYQFFKLMRSFSSLKKFMSYLEENRDSEELKQVGIREENVVNLMTVHKAKGLSFETEFFYWKPSNRGNNSADRMEFFVSFDDQYHEVKDYLLTHSRYDKYLEYLGHDFLKEKKRKEMAEEINNLYVAMTRPEKNLFLYIEGPRKLEPGKPGKNWSDSDTYGFYEQAILKGTDTASLTELVKRRKLGNLEIAGEKDETGMVKLPELSPYFQPIEIPVDGFETDLNLETKRLEGLAIHYYLEHIRYNLEEERDYAGKMLLARYGNILGPVRIKKIITRVKGFIDTNPEIFAHRWQVFNEYELRYEDRLYRIDRLLVDEERKEILILDFKSGVTRKESQLEQYQKVVEKMTAGKYMVRGRFLEVDLL